MVGNNITLENSKHEIRHSKQTNKTQKVVMTKIFSNLDIEIMGLRHTKYPIEGIQFHPESFATEGGKEILRNFLYGY